MECLRQDVDLRVLPGHELPVHPDLLDGREWHPGPPLGSARSASSTGYPAMEGRRGTAGTRRSCAIEGAAGGSGDDRKGEIAWHIRTRSWPATPPTLSRPTTTTPS